MRAHEQPQKRGQPVIPVVVAGHRVEPRRWPIQRRLRQRGAKRTLEAVFVLLAARGRIDLVTAQHEHLATGQILAVDREGGLGHQIGHGVGRVEAVAGVGHVVDPQLALVAASDRPLVVNPRRQGILQLTLVEIGAEEISEDAPDGGADQQRRTQPWDRPARGEAELLRIERGGARLVIGVTGHHRSGHGGGVRVRERQQRVARVGAELPRGWRHLVGDHARHVTAPVRPRKPRAGAVAASRTLGRRCRLSSVGRAIHS